MDHARNEKGGVDLQDTPREGLAASGCGRGFVEGGEAVAEGWLRCGQTVGGAVREGSIRRS